VEFAERNANDLSENPDSIVIVVLILRITELEIVILTDKGMLDLFYFFLRVLFDYRNNFVVGNESSMKVSYSLTL
jgi:hypothetical protein